MVVIPAGQFRMGCVAGLDCRDVAESAREVVFARPFALSAYEVTRDEFSRFAAATGHSTNQQCSSYERWLWKWKSRRGGDWRSPGFEQTDTHPVVCVNWNDVRQYVKWLSVETGEAYRLPSEAEWEYAERAGTSTMYSWGDEIGDSRANCGGRYCGDRWEATAPVGSFAPNAWGVYDMHFNVWEWVEDCWNDRHNGAPMDGSAWLRGDCDKRVARGSSWYNGPPNSRGRTRVWVRTDLPGSGTIGFRVARSLEP